MKKHFPHLMNFKQWTFAEHAAVYFFLSLIVISLFHAYASPSIIVISIVTALAYVGVKYKMWVKK